MLAFWISCWMTVLPRATMALYWLTASSGVRPWAVTEARSAASRPAAVMSFWVSTLSSSEAPAATGPDMLAPSNVLTALLVAASALVSAASSLGIGTARYLPAALRSGDTAVISALVGVTLTFATWPAWARSIA